MWEESVEEREYEGVHILCLLATNSCGVMMLHTLLLSLLLTCRVFTPQPTITNTDTLLKFSSFSALIFPTARV